MFNWFRRSSSQVSPTQRALGPMENVMMKASQQYHGYMKIGEVLYLRGPHITLDKLDTAVRCLQSRHPALRSRLQRDPDNPRSFLLEEDRTLRLEILEIPRKRDDYLTFWCREWKEREKETTHIGQGLAKFWLLQDPDDDHDKNAPREVVFICEHSISDGLSLSTVAHELLIALGSDDENVLGDSLNWPITMEKSIRESLSTSEIFFAISRLMLSAIYLRLTSMPTARVPFGRVDFTLNDMVTYCHTEAAYGMLNKEETKQLIERCHQEKVTVTSAVSAAILCAVSQLVIIDDGQETVLNVAINADTRRRCVPAVPNHDLSYHVSCIMPFVIPRRDIPTTPDGMWELARTFGHHVITAIDAGQILACGLISEKIVNKVLDSTNVSASPTCNISSWGLLPFRERYGPWELTGMNPFINQIRGESPFIIFQTVNGTLTIVVVGHDPVIPLQTTENLRDITMDTLRHMI
ncbi:unnamed protein product [Rotaria sp. Silwood2]|nr:unnamed protein product [Rotaria sp. Silwood2]CAF2567567.1 unnamed protein product [Rotaria sp. Silwood2]CAF3904941.1 unnamed protein product [Rotaria sp. Silwood2]CAF4474750.1 unnamed protein product [Rotaria sp. Silwood2]